MYFNRKEKQELRNQLLKIVTQCKDIYHPIIDQTTGYQSISREEVKKIKSVLAKMVWYVWLKI